MSLCKAVLPSLLTLVFVGLYVLVYTCFKLEIVVQVQDVIGHRWSCIFLCAPQALIMVVCFVCKIVCCMVGHLTRVFKFHHFPMLWMAHGSRAGWSWVSAMCSCFLFFFWRHVMKKYDVSGPMSAAFYWSWPWTANLMSEVPILSCTPENLNDVGVDGLWCEPPSHIYFQFFHIWVVGMPVVAGDCWWPPCSPKVCSFSMISNVWMWWKMMWTKKVCTGSLDVGYET